MKVILDSFNPNSELTLRQKKVLELLEGHLRQFEPIMSRSKEEFLEFDIKKELLRLPVFMITGLAEYVGIVDERNPFVILEELKKRNVLNDTAVNHILTALRSALIMRVLAHKHYGRDCDTVYHPCMKDRTDLGVKDPYFLLHKEVLSIIYIYRVLFPMHRIFKQFIKTRDLSILSRQNFYDETLFSQWEAQEMANKHRDEKYAAVSSDKIRSIIAQQKAAEEKEASKQPENDILAIENAQAWLNEKAQIKAQQKEIQARIPAILPKLENKSRQAVERSKTPRVEGPKNEKADRIILSSPYEVAKRRLDLLSAKQAALEKKASDARVRQDQFKQIYAKRRRTLLTMGLVKGTLREDLANLKWAKVELEKKRAKLEEFEYNRHVQKAEREIELLAQKAIQNGQPDYQGDKQAILASQELEVFKRSRDHLISEVKEAERELLEMRKIYEETKKHLDPKLKKYFDETDKALEALEVAQKELSPLKPETMDRCRFALENCKRVNEQFKP